MSDQPSEVNVCARGAKHLRRSELNTAGDIQWRCFKCWGVVTTDAFKVELLADEERRAAASGEIT